MKFLAIIFSVIVMGLTIIPCCAYDNCNEEQVSDQNSGKPETPCSPFVRCSCTSGICMPSSVSIEYIPHLIIIVNYGQCEQLFTSNYSSFIWQPPKYSC
ncbi:MAG TPA: hypothetical protein VLB84_03925 [Bacteroidia bacterium]|nr:hypothetical protein [Bacteroidia bacterium]